MFPDYQRLILETYKLKRDAGALSYNMMNPTPARLKEECLLVCTNRFQRKDGQVLSALFGQGDEQSLVYKAIDKCDIDKFRPLLNFMKEATEKPDSKQVELLAWLLDFQPRPHDSKIDYSKLEPSAGAADNFVEPEPAPQHKPGNKYDNQKPVDLTDIRGAGIGAGLATEPGAKSPTLPSKHKIIAISLALATALGAFLLWPSKTPHQQQQKLLSDTGTCMYWTGEQYKAIPCSQKAGDTLVIAFDSARLADFKRINRADTITQQSVGKIYYSKQKGILEFYTSGGFHPVNPQSKLRPLSNYMYNKYLKKAGQSN